MGGPIFLFTQDPLGRAAYKNLMFPTWFIQNLVFWTSLETDFQETVHCIQLYTKMYINVVCQPVYIVFRARILKHSMEAEKSTFRGEPSFQRSECTAGFTEATTFLCCF